MKTVLRWLGLGLASLVGLGVLALVLVYAGSEILVRRPHAKAPVTAAAARDPGAVARGARVAKLNGCNDCHGAQLEGRLFFDEMPVARIAGPNLSLKVGQQSDADLARAIRTGVAADGRALWIMPSEAYASLTDAETSDLLAYLRSKPPAGGPQPDKQLGPMGRLGLVLGKFPSAPAMIAAHGRDRLPDLGPGFAQGRSLARACVECHGADLRGSASLKAPALTVAGAYEKDDFERLLRTGIAAGGRRLGLMSETAPGRFNVLSHEEIGALHAYLKARAEAET